jgi:hypothetical protein
VYGKIQGRVAEKLDSVTPKQLTRRRNQEFQKFLDTTNTKGAIFRDIIIESEYDPLQPNRQCVKVHSIFEVVNPYPMLTPRAASSHFRFGFFCMTLISPFHFQLAISSQLFRSAATTW